jgi:hypothetical protein
MANEPAPPPCLCFSRVLAYAFVDATVDFTGKQCLLVDGKELGPVSRLAICRNLDDEDIMLFHCR